MSLVKCEGCGKNFDDTEMLFVQAGASITLTLVNSNHL